MKSLKSAVINKYNYKKKLLSVNNNNNTGSGGSRGSISSGSGSGTGNNNTTKSKVVVVVKSSTPATSKSTSCLTFQDDDESISSADRTNKNSNSRLTPFSSRRNNRNRHRRHTAASTNLKSSLSCFSLSFGGDGHHGSTTVDDYDDDIEIYRPSPLISSGSRSVAAAAAATKKQKSTTTSTTTYKNYSSFSESEDNIDIDIDSVDSCCYPYYDDDSDTSYDKAIIGSSSSTTTTTAPMNISHNHHQQQFNKRRGSLPLSMTAGINHDPIIDFTNPHQHHQQQQSSNSASSSLSSTSRLVNFFAKRSFKVSGSNQLLNRAKSANKLDQKLLTSSSGSNLLLHETVERRNSHTPPGLSTINTNTTSSSSSTATAASTPSQLINAQSLHPSVINNQHGFVTTSSDGSTQYYSCKTRAERDTWLHAIQQSIHHPERSRVENSCQLWILEGKDIGKISGSGTKRYHCEVYLDDKLYGRTNGKIRQELLFWGEEFIFNDIQVVDGSELLVSVWRREASGKKNGSGSGKGRKKEKKKELIGTVKLSLKNLESRHLVERWYPLSVETTQSSKQKPTIRLKCKYESIQILPLSCYQPLIQFVKEHYQLLCEALEPLLGVKGKEDIADALTNVLHHESIAKKFVADLALGEILKGADDKLTFRGNSIATKSMESYLKLLGSSYLESTLGELVEQLQNCDLYDCEVDPMRIIHISHLSRNQSNLRNCVDNIWQSILGSIDTFPTELKECFSYCRQELIEVGREELTGHLISASMFLRFLCPAILSPSLFHITTEYPNEKSARNLMLMAKVLQTLANFTRFQGKEGYMEFINDYVEKEASTMANFLMSISTSSTTNQSTMVTIDVGKWLSILATLLSESIDKIVGKHDIFKNLEEILKKIQQTPMSKQSLSSSVPPPTTAPPPLPSMPPRPLSQSVNQHPTPACPAYAIGNVISQTAIPLRVTQYFGGSMEPPHTSPEPQTNSSGYQSQSPVMNSTVSSSTIPLNFSNPGFSRADGGGGGTIELPNLETNNKPSQQQQQQQLGRPSRLLSSSSCSDDDDSYENTSARASLGHRPPGKQRPLTNPLLKNQQQFRSTAALELQRSSHPGHSMTTTRHLSSSDSDSGIANNVQQSRPRKIRYTNRRSPDGCPEPAETKTLEEYENEMIELRQAMEILQTKLYRAEERLFGGPQPPAGALIVGVGAAAAAGGAAMRPRSSTILPNADLLIQQSNKRLSTASARELEMEGLLQRLLSAEEEMKREQELLSALDQKQKLIDAQEQKITHLDTVNTQLITALSKIHSSLQQQQQHQAQQQRQPDPSTTARPKAMTNQSLPSPALPAPAPPPPSPHINNNDISNNNANTSASINNNNSTIVRITTGGESSVMTPSEHHHHHHAASRRSMSPDSLNGTSSSPASPPTVLIGEHELKLLAEMKSSSC